MSLIASVTNLWETILVGYKKLSLHGKTEPWDTNFCK